MSRTKAAAPEARIAAIVDRYNGVPYEEVLSKYSLTPNQFAQAVHRDLEILANGTSNRALEEILSNPDIKDRLFEMSESFLRNQYDRVQEGEQSRLFAGTRNNPNNVIAIIYYALTKSNPDLLSNDREKIIDTIRSMPRNLVDYFNRLKIRGLMKSDFLGIDQQDSPLAVLQIFDLAYQRKTGDASLFDLSQTHHLHEWGDGFIAQESYWKKPINGSKFSPNNKKIPPYIKTRIDEAVYHVLTENSPELALDNRQAIVKAIKGMPLKLKQHLNQIGLKGVIKYSFADKKGYCIKAVFEVFDKIYQRKTGDASLFDNTQEHYIEFNSQNRLKR